MAEEERRKLCVLTSPAFLLPLCLLLLNDFVLKPRLDNWLTGKASDFAGLFVFPLFWSALFPRFGRAVYLLTAAAFTFWKSAYSQPLIDAWNGLALLPLGRTVDASDLLALLALPVSFLYFVRGGRRPSRPLAPYLVAAAALFAFTATSYRTEFPYDNKYPFQMSRAELTRRVFNLGRAGGGYRINPCGFEGVTPDRLKVTIPSKFCFDSVNATFAVGEEQGRGVITIKHMQHECPEGGDDKAALLSIFEKEFIGRLSQASPSAPVDELPEVPPARDGGPGRLYLLAFGEPRGVSLQELADHLGRVSGARVRVLPSLPLGEDVRDPRFPNSRPQAERMVEQMRAAHPKLAADPDARLVGVAQDFYVEGTEEAYPSHYVTEGRLAVVSLDALDPKTFCEPADDELLRGRLRKLLAGLHADAPAPPAR